ncbi:MAG: hypothetical protein QM534_18185 [Sediminibacterium sp.]|nr:hypothetical protein [Sediminibacterium sp.]
MRASEKIESAANFLRLYSPTIIDALIDKSKSDKLWKNVVFIHSSPGAGKTSLLRVFEPLSLRTLFNTRSSPEYKEIYNKLKELQVINEDRIELLGVTLVCTRNYEILEELDVSPGQKIRFFFSLLNARIILSTLRAILQLHNKQFPEGLKEIQFNYADESNHFLNLTVPCNGKELYDWASNIERKIYTAIDSFLPISEIAPDGHDELFAFSVLKPEYFKINDQQIFSKILFMLDDTHKLSQQQRQRLEKYILERRGNFNIWISERLEALEPKENLRSYRERDYEEINLERFWDDRSAKLKQILLNVADKRASLSSEDINSFHEYIETNLNEEAFKKDFLEIIESTNAELLKITSHTDKFNEWLTYFSSYEGNPMERAILLKKIEILIARHVNKNQLSFDFPHTKDELIDKLKADLEAPAKLFLSKDNKIPYYHGLTTLANLSSNNIEQFLSFSSDLYEEMLSNKLTGKDITLDSINQEKIIRLTVDKKWSELPKLLPYANEVVKFLSELGDFCNKQTYQKNAPYGTGVNGFSIKEKKELKLIEEEEWIQNEIYEPLINVISTCVAYNLLEIKKTKQGEKDKVWDVYYLNRWLCVKFDLPLSYGGFRHRSPDELIRWIKR